MSDPCNEARLQTVEKSIEKIENSVAKIADSMALIARLEERHAITREAVEKVSQQVENIDGRLVAVEIVVPMLKEARGWLIAGVLGVVAAVGSAIFQHFQHHLN